MGLLSWLKRKVRRQKKQKKPAVPEQKSETEDDEKMGDVVMLYPLYDPRVVRSEGTEPPLLGQKERVLSLSKQMTGIHAELRSGEVFDVPYSESDDVSENVQGEGGSEASENIPLRPLRGDFSPLSVGSMETFSTPTKSLSKPSSFQLLPPLKAPPKIAPREKQPEPKAPAEPKEPPLPPPPPPAPEPPAPQLKEEPAAPPAAPATPPAPPAPPAAPAAPKTPAPLPPPPHLKPASPDSSRKSSPSAASFYSSEISAEGSEKAADIENLPTAPTTPRGVRTLEYTKQPRLLLLQPYVKPHPATTRMQREGRRHILRCEQLQAAIDLYAARGGLDVFRVGPHDADECNSCRFTDFTDTPLLW